MPSRSPKQKLSLAIGFTIGLVPVHAFASENFPPNVKALYRLVEDPDCTVCHETIEGGDQTVDKPFGLDLIDRGTKGKDAASLVKALRSAYQSRQDSDGDEVSDFEELHDGTNPNLKDATPDPSTGAGGDGAMEPLPELGDVPELPPPPGYGCAVAGGAFGSRATGFLLFAVAMAACLRRRPG